jgi:hypothetical protein
VLGVDVDTVWETELKKVLLTEVMPGQLSSAEAAVATDPLPSWE